MTQSLTPPSKKAGTNYLIENDKGRTKEVLKFYHELTVSFN